MASLRKKYQAQIASPERDDGPPVLPPPVMGAELPPAVESKPIEPVVETSPADEAGKNRLRDELRKMERAEALQREQQQPPQHAEPQELQQPPAMPAHVQKWLDEHPQYMNDQIGQLELYVATAKCTRDGKRRDFCLTAFFAYTSAWRSPVSHREEKS